MTVQLLMKETEIIIRIGPNREITVLRRDFVEKQQTVKTETRNPPQANPHRVSRVVPAKVQEPKREVFTREEAATFLRVKSVTIDRLRKRGLLRANQATRRPLYTRGELERFLREYRDGEIKV